MTRLEVDGWEVAQVELDRSWSGREPADRCSLFRSPSAWTLVSTDHRVRYGDDDEPVSARATITAEVFATVEELAEHVHRTYTGGAWVDLLRLDTLALVSRPPPRPPRHDSGRMAGPWERRHSATGGRVHWAGSGLGYALCGSAVVADGPPDGPSSGLPECGLCARKHARLSATTDARREAGGGTGERAPRHLWPTPAYPPVPRPSRPRTGT